MFLDFSQGTFLWQWFHSWAGLNGMAIALIVAALSILLTKWTPQHRRVQDVDHSRSRGFDAPGTD